jgi:hypothetical protein
LYNIKIITLESIKSLVFNDIYFVIYNLYNIFFLKLNAPIALYERLGKITGATRTNTESDTLSSHKLLDSARLAPNAATACYIITVTGTVHKLDMIKI